MGYSPSRFNCFDECNYKFYLQYIRKVFVRWEEKPFFEKGKYFHYALEHYPNKPPKPFKFKLSDTEDKKKYQKQLLAILKNPEIKDLLLRDHETEQRLQVSEDWGTDNKSLLSGIVDYFHFEGNVCRIIDWKSGKVYKDKGELQLKLYALWILLKYPDIDTVKSCYLYLEHNVKTEYVYKRKDLESIKQFFVDKIQHIENITVFEKCPTSFCKWCDFHGKYCSAVKSTINR